jgi:peptide/nickel transport system substrate-binding protein
VVPLHFASLIGRITRTFDYEACLLGLTNIEPDPNSQMNVWLSSGSNHPWYPNQKTPHTHWEAEMDRLMRAQTATLDSQKRKMLFDQVQEIVSEQAPILYLVNRNALMAISATLHNASPAALSPNVFWNVEHLRLLPEAIQKK